MVNIGRTTIVTVLLLVTLAFVYASPNLLSRGALDGLPSWAPSKQINLGLDLQGGSYLLLDVDTDAVVVERLEAMLDALRRDLRRERIFFQPGSLSIANDSAGFVPRDAERREDALLIARRIARDESGDNIGSVVGFGGGPTVEAVELPNGRIAVVPSEDALDQWRSNAVEQSIEVVRRRVDETGTNEPTIQRQGEDRIVVALPGLQDPERLKRLLGQTAKLNFHFVMENADPNARRAPPGGLILPTEEVGFNGEPLGNYVVERRPMVGGDRLVDAQQTFQDGRAVVAFR
ncbi:MAG: protein translocase subunit SecD, partial [Pseudomonadota bacterium]